MEINAEKIDKALHEIPEFIRELEEMIGVAKKLEKQLIDFRQNIIKSIEDEEVTT